MAATDSTSAEILCMGCAARGRVSRVTAGLQCRCGSHDLDLWQDTPAQRRFVAQKIAQRREARQVQRRPSAPPEFSTWMTGRQDGRKLDRAHFMGLAAGGQRTATQEGPQGPRRQPVGGDVPGWNEYSGPMPGVNQMSNGIGTPYVCSVCHGSRMDLQDGGPCRACGGTGLMTPNADEHDEVPLVARHPYPSTQTTIPFVGQRALPPGQTSEGSPGRNSAPRQQTRRSTKTVSSKGRRSPQQTQAARTSADPLGSVEHHIRTTTPGYSDQGGSGPDEAGFYPTADTRSPAIHHREPHDYSSQTARQFVMPEASCPNCGTEPTHLRKDHAEDAWWTCPNCGPLANIDKHPEIDPYNPPNDFVPSNKGFKTGRRLLGGKKTGRLMRVIATAGTQNPGLRVPELLEIARRTIELLQS